MAKLSKRFYVAFVFVSLTPGPAPFYPARLCFFLSDLVLPFVSCLCRFYKYHRKVTRNTNDVFKLQIRHGCDL
jgi:hypothetical protein